MGDRSGVKEKEILIKVVNIYDNLFSVDTRL